MCTTHAKRPKNRLLACRICPVRRMPRDVPSSKCCEAEQTYLQHPIVMCIPLAKQQHLSCHAIGSTTLLLLCPSRRPVFNCLLITLMPSGRTQARLFELPDTQSAYKQMEAVACVTNRKGKQGK